MPKDLKIGLAVGLGFVIVAILWLATRPSLTPQARIQRLHNTDARQEASIQTDTRSSTPDTRYTMEENQETGTDKPESDIPKPQTSIQNSLTSSANPESSIQNEQTETIKTERFYIVRKNDTLSSISREYYGTATKWPKIFEANRQSVPDANKLAIGTKLIIPD